MLPKLSYDIEKQGECIIKKFVLDRDVSDMGAFKYGDVINFEVMISRSLGARGIVMRICLDGDIDSDIPFEFASTDSLYDIYSLSLDTRKICKEEYGLFYYELLLLRGDDTLFTDSYNNFDFNLSHRSSSRFRMLVYESDYTTPECFGEGVMYHIFVDRFCKGDGEDVNKIKCKSDARMNEDWDNGIPEYARVQGEHLSNNEFFGGNLIGVMQKLDYLKNLGVKTIYLSPVFEAYSNHKYDTGDYFKVDSMFGGDEALDKLIFEAKKRGIGIILDGVFNHTGDDSLYFNRYGKYDSIGAYNSQSSKYKDWYFFKNWPDEYESWWGIEILPKLNHKNEECRQMITGKEGVIRRYIKKGIAGWRLDVADELCDEMLDEIRAGAKEESDGNAVIIGEVWENACDKIAYGKRRRYFSGRQLDSVMNYPLRNAIIEFCTYGSVDGLYNTLTEIYTSYPRCVSYKLMNILGTHDTERILTVLGSELYEMDEENEKLAHKTLSEDKRNTAIKFLKIAAAIQYMSYGIPSLYYGDEVGLEGYHDPFCRMPYPWNKIDGTYREDIRDYYIKLGKIRTEYKSPSFGEFCVVEKGESHLSFARKYGDELIITSVNRGNAIDMPIPENEVYEELITGIRYTSHVTLEPNSAMIFKVSK